MKPLLQPNWNLTPREAARFQEEWRQHVVLEDRFDRIRIDVSAKQLVVGLDFLVAIGGLQRILQAVDILRIDDASDAGQTSQYQQFLHFNSNLNCQFKIYS